MREVESGARDVELESGPGTTREVESGMEGLCSLESGPGECLDVCRDLEVGKPSNYRSRRHLRAVDGSLTFMLIVRGKVRADPLTALSNSRSSHHVHT
ncbi:hypothetical protein Pmani_026098 [Petrolisthes manimaculis]|uniref:Uncharacterized protein n=1 Tax=Petrolisthes manimaculis TaxID=1843537 RepID=A0AAE1P5V1_9EUCA|nr:hypothetical protein Pmani_026098 [Petrolisthes manimaculis]